MTETIITYEPDNSLKKGYISIFSEIFNEKIMEKKYFDKNVTLSVQFSRYVIEHPEVAEKIPKGAQVVLLLQDDPELCKQNLEPGAW